MNAAHNERECREDEHDDGTDQVEYARAGEHHGEDGKSHIDQHRPGENGEGIAGDHGDNAFSQV